MKLSLKITVEFTYPLSSEQSYDNLSITRSLHFSIQDLAKFSNCMKYIINDIFKRHNIIIN